jgi:hypothetical protein
MPTLSAETLLADGVPRRVLLTSRLRPFSGSKRLQIPGEMRVSQPDRNAGVHAFSGPTLCSRSRCHWDKEVLPLGWRWDPVGLGVA